MNVKVRTKILEISKDFARYPDMNKAVSILQD
jgi:hypothetical protein